MSFSSIILATEDGAIPIDAFDDDFTFPLNLPCDLDPMTHRLLTKVQNDTATGIAADLAAYGGGRDVLIPVSVAVERIRSLQWANVKKAK
jgi:hypothetical protein